MNLCTLPSTQNIFSVLLDSVCAVTALITNCDKSQIATAGIPELSQFVTVAICDGSKHNFSDRFHSNRGYTPKCRKHVHINLSSGVLNRHKLRQSQIATIQESLPSQFVICSNLWSRRWRHKLSPITPKTCSLYLVEYPSSLLTWIWKFTFLQILVLFHWYTCFYVYLS